MVLGDFPQQKRPPVVIQPQPKSTSGSFSPTDEQLAVVEAVRRPQGSVMVEAGAGCAKTSTVKLASQKIKVPALALAFNKRIAEDLEKALPASFTCKTLNGLGHQAWARSLPEGCRLQLDDRKISKLVKQINQDWKLEATSDQWENIRDLVRAAQAAGLVPSSDPRASASLVPDTKETWEELGDAQSIPREDLEWGWEAAREALMRSNQQARQGLVSFDDQVYCSVMLGGKFPQFPVSIIDEDQDLSPLNIKMLELATRPDGRIIAVGDRRQAIYAWRGAAGDSAQRIKSLRPADNWVELPLLTTFRCPRLVVERQQQHLPGFTAASSAPQGAVIRFHRPTDPSALAEYTGWGWAQIVQMLAAQPGPKTPEAAVLCRNNAPLVSLAIKLIRQGIGVKMLGRDIGKGLEQLSRRLSPDDQQPRHQHIEAIERWQHSETQLALALGYKAKAESIQDRAECLLAVAEQASATNAGEARATLRRIFASETGLVTLSSIHRSKGLEWDLVVHLDPWRLPSKFARVAAAAGNLVPLEHEYNLQYVCETRTRHSLVLANLEDWQQQ